MSDDLTELVVRSLIVMATVTWGVVLWRAERNESMPNFSFRNLIATRDGYPDRVAIMELGAFIAMSAVIIFAVLRKSSELATLCGIYVGAFTLRGGMSAWVHATNPPSPGVKTVQTDSSSTTTSTVTPAVRKVDDPDK